jgi:hypothetical protein
MPHKNGIINRLYADVMELADMQDLGSCGVTHAGSIPVIRIFFYFT